MIFVLFKKNLRQFLLLLFFPFANFADSFVAHNRDSSKSSMITASATSITGSSPTSVLALATRDEPLDQKPETENDVGRATEVNSNNMDGASPMDPRSCILNVGASAGKLCYVANQLLPERESETDALLTQTLAELFVSLWLTAKALRLDWVKSIRSKMALNAKKYPVEHCKGKAGKYTNYSHLTGITTTNQSTLDYTHEDTRDSNCPNSDRVDLSLAGFAEQHLSVLAEDIRIFAEERQWARYHKPRNLVMALLGEAGELAEILQFEKDDWEETENDEPRLLLVDKLHSSEPERLDELSQELADVSIYALRLATVCGQLDNLRDSLVQQQPPQDLEAKQLFA